MSAGSGGERGDGPYREASTREPDEPPPDPRGPWVLQTWVSQRHCPNCDVSLFAARKEGFRIDACAQCGGSWLDHAVATSAVEQRSLVPADLAAEAEKRAPGRPHAQHRKCPVCSIELTEVRVHDAGVVVDECAEHGAWFDPSEMRRVIEAIVRRTPPPFDLEVEQAIERETRLGALRPPENYQPSDAMFTRSPAGYSLIAMIVETIQEARRK